MASKDKKIPPYLSRKKNKLQAPTYRHKAKGRLNKILIKIIYLFSSSIFLQKKYKATRYTNKKIEWKEEI